MIGTRGVPAAYGGFETAVEEVGRRRVERGHSVLVYGREAGDGNAYHLGMRRVTLPAVRQKALETLSHTALSTAHAITRARPDVALVFNAANSPWLPALRAMRIPVATHVDGLEWRRGKWNAVGQAYYRLAEQFSVRWSDALIADAQGIADYYAEEFEAPTDLIAYGAPLIDAGSSRLAELDLAPRGYHLVVARFEKENHVDVIVDGYRRSAATRPLVVVGSAPYADEYTASIHELADDRVRFLGGVWDQGLLDQLYGNALTYVHGHSVGGTNPSLLRALGAGAPVLAYDVRFNREVVGESGRYFLGADGVRQAIEAAEAEPADQERRSAASRERARAYDWDDVTDRYAAMLRRLATDGPTRRRPSGLRTGAWER